MTNNQDICNALRHVCEYRIDPQNAAREIVTTWLMRKEMFLPMGEHGQGIGSIMAV
jgi:hypothetical protein